MSEEEQEKAPPSPVGFWVTAEELVTELNYHSKVVDKKSTLPILQSILINADRQVSIESTDLDKTLITNLPSTSVAMPGKLVINFARLHTIAKKLGKSAGMTFSQTPEQAAKQVVQIDSGRFKVELPVGDPAEYPATKQPELNQSLHAGDLNRLLSQVKIALCKEESRYALRGALFQNVPESYRIRMVSTDGHRLIIAEAPGTVDLQKPVILPGDSMALVELITREKGKAGYLDFGIDGEHVGFKYKNRTVYSRLLVGQFPSYEVILPTNLTHRTYFAPADMLAAFARIAAATDDGRAHGTAFYCSANAIHIGSSYEDVFASDEIDAQGDGGIVFAFNRSYLGDFFSLLGKDAQAVIESEDDTKPVQVRNSLDEQGLLRYICMPMRLEDALFMKLMGPHAYALQIVETCGGYESAINQLVSGEDFRTGAGWATINEKTVRQALVTLGFGPEIAKREAASTDEAINAA